MVFLSMNLTGVEVESIIFWALVVHPPFPQLVKSKASPSLEETQAGRRSTFAETKVRSVLGQSHQEQPNESPS